LRFPVDALDAWGARDDSKGSEAPTAAPQRRSRRRATPNSPGGIPLLPVRGAGSAP
jgi:hypothetical protein